MGHEPPQPGINWPPDTDETGPPRCDRCDTAVSDSFRRQWEDNDGILDGCRQCLPRSVRFGEDVYGRDKDVVQEQFDLDIHNKGKPVGGVQRGSENDDAPETPPTPLTDSE